MSVIIDRKSLKSATGGQFKADKGGKGFSAAGDMAMSGRKEIGAKKPKNGQRKEGSSTSKPGKGKL